jgi:hypothetical protein
VFPVVNVFFELGRKGTSCARDPLQAYRLVDIQYRDRGRGGEGKGATYLAHAHPGYSAVPDCKGYPHVVLVIHLQFRL